MMRATILMFAVLAALAQVKGSEPPGDDFSCTHCPPVELDRLVALLGDDVLRNVVCRLSGAHYTPGRLSMALRLPEGQVLRRIDTLRGWGLVRLVRRDSVTTIVEPLPGDGARTLERWADKYCAHGESCGTAISDARKKARSAKAAGGVAAATSSEDDSGAERFFRFMIEREKLRLRKDSGAAWPWSDDPILNAYKFTNIKREFDRTTRWMRDNWTSPNEQRPFGEIIFNCGLFRYFGTTEFAEAIGWQRRWSPDRIVDAAQERQRRGERTFTGAYIIPTLGHRGAKSEVVCHSILTPLWEARDAIAAAARQTRSWRLVAREMRELPGFGGTGFMTKEVLQDAMHTPVLRDVVDRNDWCPAGPGARRALNRIHGRPLHMNVAEAKLIGEMRALFARARDYMPPFMPELELHDIQFQLCEFDKYERVRLGEERPKARYWPEGVHR